MSDFLSKDDLKDMLGLSISTIDRNLKKLPRIKLGGRNSKVLFPRADVEKYLREILSTKS